MNGIRHEDLIEIVHLMLTNCLEIPITKVILYEVEKSGRHIMY